MALGVDYSSTAPQLIQSSGQALVQGIRQIGQQISGALTEMQTKRDLGAMAQELQGLNVQSNEFPLQLTQLLSRHPLAARDERGQMALSVLGQAHGQWQAGEAEARAFNRAMAMQTRRTRDARTQFEYEEEARKNRPVSVPTVGLVQPSEIDPLTGQPKILVPAAPRAGSNRPTVLNQGDVAIDATGKKIAENPKLPTKSASEARMQKKQRIDLLMRMDASARTEFGRLESRRDALSKQRMELKADDPNAVYLDNTVRAIEAEAAELKKRRDDIRKRIEEIEIVPADEQEEVLVPAGEVPAPVSNASARIPVIGPDGKSGTVSAAQLESALQNGYQRR